MVDQVNHPFVIEKVVGQCRNPLIHPYKAICNLSIVSSVSPSFADTPAENGFAIFTIDFLMGGVLVVVSKIATAPIERVELLL